MNKKSGYTLVELLAIIQIVFFVAVLVTWFVNLTQLLSCDFKEPYKAEIVHGIGLIPPACFVTAFMDTEDGPVEVTPEVTDILEETSYKNK